MLSMETKQKIRNSNKLVATMQNLSNTNNEAERMWTPNAHNNTLLGQNELNRENERQCYETGQHIFENSHVKNRKFHSNLPSSEVDPNLIKYQKLPKNYHHNQILKERVRNKRKYPQEFIFPSAQNRLTCVSDPNEAEVLKAAKSLFSKRTRTLYHWMYPDTPKTQLKAAVEASWETLRAQEKEFYIYQVLGPFGFPQVNVMLNPQLGCLPGTVPGSLLSSVVTAGESSSNRLNNSSFGSGEIKKRHRLGRPPGSKNKRALREDNQQLKSEPTELNPEDFQDDPELSQEFQQFEWNLHLNDNN